MLSKQKNRKRKSRLGEDMMLFTTDPHGAQQVIRVEKYEDARFANSEHIGNSLYAIEDDSKKRNVILFTGEELTDLARQWLSYVGVDVLALAHMASVADKTTIKGRRLLARKANETIEKFRVYKKTDLATACLKAGVS